MVLVELFVVGIVSVDVVMGENVVWVKFGKDKGVVNMKLEVRSFLLFS